MKVRKRTDSVAGRCGECSVLACSEEGVKRLCIPAPFKPVSSFALACKYTHEGYRVVKVCSLSFTRNDVCQRDGGGVLGASLSMPPGGGVLGENSTCTWLCCRLVYSVDGAFIGYCQQLRSQSIGTIALHMRCV